MIITRRDLENKARCEALVEMKLDDMGVDSKMAMDDLGIDDKGEVRAAAKEYYMKLLWEHLDNSAEVTFDQYLDDQAAMMWGFVEGYEACLKKQLAL